MDSLDRTIAQMLNEADPVSTHRDESAGRVLVLSADNQLRRLLIGELAKRGHRCSSACRLSDQGAAVSERFDVIVAQHSLIAESGLNAPSAGEPLRYGKIIVVSETGSSAEAVNAMRLGAVDFVTLPIDPDDFARRVNAAIAKSRQERDRERRLQQLKKVCGELNVARREIARHVDALCADLASTHEQMAQQMSDVAMTSEFRTLLRQELDVEDLLRTMLEYLLTKTGPTNAAVFLPDTTRNGNADAGQYGLGAYVNYDCPRQTIAVLLDHLSSAIGPRMEDEAGIVWFKDASEFAQWIGTDANIAAESQVIAFACRHEEECLAVIVLFRGKSDPFDRKLNATLQSLRAIIAEQLSNVIRILHRARPNWPKEAHEGDADYRDDAGSEFEGGLAA